MNTSDDQNTSNAGDGFDWSVFESIESMAGENAEEVLAEIINQYLLDAPERLREINQALATTNAEQLRQSAHSLRSISLSLGANRLSQICLVLEELGQAGNVGKTGGLIKSLEIEYTSVEHLLRHKLQRFLNA